MKNIPTTTTYNKPINYRTGEINVFQRGINSIINPIKKQVEKWIDYNNEQNLIADQRENLKIDITTTGKVNLIYGNLLNYHLKNGYILKGDVICWIEEYILKQSRLQLNKLKENSDILKKDISEYNNKEGFFCLAYCLKNGFFNDDDMSILNKILLDSNSNMSSFLKTFYDKEIIYKYIEKMGL